jgi:F-type H+-transporting ATPase subunit epsilon
MKLDIITPERIIYDGNVYGIILPGAEGYLELLENHAPIIAALGKGTIKVIVEKNATPEQYNVTGGFVEMSNNKVMVLIEGAETIN